VVLTAAIGMATPAGSARVVDHVGLSEAEQILSSQPEWQAMVDAYQRDYPELSRRSAEIAVIAQSSRSQLLEQVHSVAAEYYAGSWYDPRLDVQHVRVKSGSAALEDSRAIADRAEISVKIHASARSLRELGALADQINEGGHRDLGADGVDRAVVNVESNLVDVYAAEAQQERLRARTADPGVRIVSGVSPLQQPVELDVCTTRQSCGSPLRGGITIGPAEQADNCSLGFTAAASDGSRWAVTAAHCGTLNQRWWHGEQVIGPFRYPVNQGNMDFARIHIQNSYWTSGGYMYNAGSPNSPRDVDFQLYARYLLQQGDVLCFNARFAEANGACGTIADPTATHRGMIEVNYDACGGDSGGGWYEVLATGRRAVGIHSASSEGCHNHTTGNSWFTATPDIIAHWDATTTATLRFETR
jgi:streptogrisin C